MSSVIRLAMVNPSPRLPSDPQGPSTWALGANAWLSSSGETSVSPWSIVKRIVVVMSPDSSTDASTAISPWAANWMARRTA
jgi:hypothetical protein